MGIAAIGLAVGVAQTAYQVVQGNKANRARKRSTAIQNANESLRNRTERRRKIKELRIRRAQIAQSSENTGVSGSSGELGASSALGTSGATSLAEQKQNSLAIQGINRENQNFQTAASKSDAAGAFGDLINEGLKLFED